MNIDRLKSRLAQLEAQQNGGSSTNNTSVIWKPTPGKHLIRILPYKYRPDWPFLELAFHYEVAGRTLVSPTSIDPTSPDPIIEFADKLRRTGDKNDFRISRKIAPRQRTYVPILVRGKEEEGVKFWGFGQTVYTELLKTIDDPDYGDITNMTTGRDITVEYEEPTEKNKYGSTIIRVKPATTPVISSDAANTPQGKKILESIKTMAPIEEVFTVPTYEELQAMLEKYIAGGAEAEAQASADEGPSDLPWDKPQNNKKKIEEAFDNLFSMD